MGLRAKSPALEAAVSRIREFVLLSQKGTYLPRIVPKEFPHRPDAETLERKDKISRFQNTADYQRVAPSQYTEFLKVLYPMRNRMGRLEPGTYSKTKINHALLYKHYCFLPEPGVMHMDPDDFEVFMASLISRRNFVKPGALSLSRANYCSPIEILVGYEKTVEARANHLGMCSKIVGDLTEAGLSVTPSERNQLMFMTFFKDKPEFMEMVQNALAKMDKSDAKYQHFDQLVNHRGTAMDMKIYMKLREQIGELKIGSLNILLQTGIRHGVQAMVAHLKTYLNRGDITPNRRTYQILVEENAMRGDVEGVVKAMEHIPPGTALDIRLLNSIISGLVQMGHPDLAESLIAPFMDVPELGLKSDEIFMKLLTSEDRAEYSRRMAYFDESEEKVPLKLHPTEETFLPLLKYYCTAKNTTFDHINKILFCMENTYGLPVTTRIFLLLFDSFVDSDYSIEDLRYITGKLISLHDAYYDVSDIRLRDKMERVQMPTELVSLLNDVMSTSPPQEIPSDKGTFTKLLDELVLRIYDAYISVIKDPRLVREIEHQRRVYVKSLGKARHLARLGPLSDGPTAHHLYKRDEFVYLKKAFVIDLLDNAEKEGKEWEKEGEEWEQGKLEKDTSYEMMRLIQKTN